MPNVLHLCHQGWTRLSAWVARHPWVGSIVGALAVAIVHRTLARAFSFLFPALSTVLYGTFERVAPILFLASSLFLLAVLGFLLATTFSGRASGRMRPAQPQFAGRQLAIAVLVIGGCAGVALVDGYLASGAAHRTERTDPP